MSSSQGTMIYLYLQLTQRNQVFSVKMTFKVMENFIFIPLKLIILRSVSCAQCCVCFCIDNLISNIYFFTLCKYLFMFKMNFVAAKLITIFLDHRFIAVINFLCGVLWIIVHLFDLLIYLLYCICSFSMDVSFFFFNNNIFLFKMLVTFLLQKPKLLMKYFILIFSYIIKILSNNII